MKIITWVVATIIGIITILSSVFGGFGFLEGRYALASEQVKIERRLTIFELRALHRATLADVYFYRDQSRKYPKDEELKDRLKELEAEAKSIKEQIKKAVGNRIKPK